MTKEEKAKSRFTLVRGEAAEGDEVRIVYRAKWPGTWVVGGFLLFIDALLVCGAVALPSGNRMQVVLMAVILTGVFAFILLRQLLPRLEVRLNHGEGGWRRYVFFPGKWNPLAYGKGTVIQEELAPKVIGSPQLVSALIIVPKEGTKNFVIRHQRRQEDADAFLQIFFGTFPADWVEEEEEHEETPVEAAIRRTYEAASKQENRPTRGIVRFVLVLLAVLVFRFGGACYFGDSGVRQKHADAALGLFARHADMEKVLAQFDRLPWNYGLRFRGEVARFKKELVDYRELMDRVLASHDGSPASVSALNEINRIAQGRVDGLVKGEDRMSDTIFVQPMEDMYKQLVDFCRMASSRRAPQL